MVKIFELNQPEWEEWVSSRPQIVQELCRKFPPDRLYRLNPTGQRVTIAAYSEDGTVRVDVSKEYNLVIFERTVFGVNPEDLQECDLPIEGEVLGALLAEPEDIHAHCDLSRDQIRGKL